jgi:uncharacterized protein YyaL (SSP411 family)
MYIKVFNVLMLLMGCTSPALAQLEIVPVKKKVDWLYDWPQALAEAKRTERPIMLIFAVPACEYVPGMW